MNYKLVVDKNNKFISEPCMNDKRYSRYLAEDVFGRKIWLLKTEIITLVNSNNLDNVKLVGEKLVFSSNFVIKQFKIEDKNYLIKYLNKCILSLNKNKVYVNVSDYERILESNLLDYFLISNDYYIGGVYKNEKMIKLFLVSKEYDLNFITIFEAKETLEDISIIFKIVENFKHPILCNLFFSSRGLKLLETKGFKDISRFSKISKQWGLDGEYEYRFSKFYLTLESPNIIVKSMEKNKYPKINLQDIKIKSYTAQEFLDFLYPFKDDIFNDMYRVDRLNEWCKKNHSFTCVGFDIFNLTDVINKADRNNTNMKYLVAYVGKTVMGLIKYGYYNSSQMLSYIDVCAAYRNMGISVLLFQNLDKYLDTDYPIMITTETEMGRKCGMLEKAKKYIHSVPVYSEDEAVSNPNLLKRRD